MLGLHNNMAENMPRLPKLSKTDNEIKGLFKDFHVPLLLSGTFKGPRIHKL